MSDPFLIFDSKLVKRGPRWAARGHLNEYGEWVWVEKAEEYPGQWDEDET